MRQAIDGIEEWIQETMLEGKEKLLRKFLYLGICVLEQWISFNADFQTRLARLAGTETPAQEIQT